MATLSFSFDTGNITTSRIVDAIAQVYGYTAEVRNPDWFIDENGVETPVPKYIPNPQTKAQFAKQQVKRFIVDAVYKAESNEAVVIATASVTTITLGD